MTGAALSRAAEALAGVSFRLHGRDPATGLDCIGLLDAALRAIDRPADFPRNYGLRHREIIRLLPDPATCGFAAVEGPIQPGDVIMTRPGPCQFHLAIALNGRRFVHAHARLRRVVIQPGPMAGAVTHHWRLLPVI